MKYQSHSSVIERKLVLAQWQKFVQTNTKITRNLAFNKEIILQMYIGGILSCHFVTYFMAACLQKLLQAAVVRCGVEVTQNDGWK